MSYQLLLLCLVLAPRKREAVMSDEITYRQALRRQRARSSTAPVESARSGSPRGQANWAQGAR